jgi:cysteinyl-tRNA synthetase
MALELIRQRFGTQMLDIHAGGVDLIFPHHEDEIAQSCGYTGQETFARFWVHGEFLNIAGTKMSKRYGNILTPRDLREQGIDGAAVRLLMYSTHYRKTLDWNDDALAGAQEAARRLGEFQKRLMEAPASSDGPAFREASERLEREFSDALDDDLNAPRALATVFAFVSAANSALDDGQRPGPAAMRAWARIANVLDVASSVVAVKLTADSAAHGVPTADGSAGELSQSAPAEDQAEDWARAWALRRKQAKARRDFTEADRIRELLRSAGWEVRDNRDGSIEVVQTRRAV